MPLSEFLRLAIEKLEASKKKSCSADLSVSGTENNNIVEVVWEDSSTHHSLSPNTPSVRDATLGNSITESLGVVDSSIFDDISPVVPSGELDLSQNCNCDEAIRYLDNGQDAFKFSSSKARPLCSWPPQEGQGQTSLLSGISGINRQDVMFGNGAKVRDVVSDSSSMKMEKHAAVVKANLPISGGISSSVKETDSACRCSNPVKSMLIQRLTGKRKDMDLYVPSAPTMVNSTTAVDGDRTVEPIFASSSVGSGNSADIVSYEETHNLKRKFCNIGSECRRDDIQIESIGVIKPSGAGVDTGARKSRTAEVHNLSERRRRDRINEKMRALQELIPNCNKADKASMLDDAIQYLKNLQRQVQVYKTVSMGAGVCVPPMMFAQGSQNMYPASIPHYSPMGVGMGMNMSYPIFPVHANFQGTPGPNHPIHGHLCPGFHGTVPRPPSRISTQNEVPSTSLNLNSKDPMKSTNLHNAEGSRPISRANKQGSD